MIIRRFIIKEYTFESERVYIGIFGLMILIGFVIINLLVIASILYMIQNNSKDGPFQIFITLFSPILYIIAELLILYGFKQYK
jgi:hypothetical protein